jgi:signal transduction histidine kinase
MGEPIKSAGGCDDNIRSRESTKAEQHWAVVEINNTGQISEGEKDRFTLGEGRGRGLHTCARLVKNMTGTMSVEPEEGQTTFCIMLPLVEP